MSYDKGTDYKQMTSIVARSNVFSLALHLKIYVNGRRINNNIVK